MSVPLSMVGMWVPGPNSNLWIQTSFSGPQHQGSKHADLAVFHVPLNRALVTVRIGYPD